MIVIEIMIIEIMIVGEMVIGIMMVIEIMVVVEIMIVIEIKIKNRLNLNKNVFCILVTFLNSTLDVWDYLTFSATLGPSFVFEFSTTTETKLLFNMQSPAKRD